MTEADLRSYYESRRAEFSRQLDAVKENIKVISHWRLGVASIFLLLLYLGWSSTSVLYLLIIPAGLFLYFVQRHSRLFEHKRHLEDLVRIHQSELEGLDGNYSSFDAGTEFIDVHHAFTHDLDVFGDGSLFQALNRCSTRGGKKALASRLSSLMQSPAAIVEYQHAVSDVASKSDFRHEIQARGMRVEEFEDDRRQLREWVMHPAFLYGKGLYHIALVVFPVITIVLLVLAFVLDGIAPFFWLAFALQWGFLAAHLKRINEFHQYISRKKNLFAKYGFLLKAIDEQPFDSALMKRLSGQARDAHKKLSALASMVGSLDARLNSLMTLVVNGVFLYDMQFVYRLERWKEDNAGKLEMWLETIEEVEVVCSFGTFTFNNQVFVFPTINETGRLKAGEIAHPQIGAGERVSNDLHIDREHSIMIITGANMAGKSTFLRTIGVNVLLALNGAPVCAKAMDCPVIEMRSGMRTADSLRDHQSYFYAELHRLQSIITDLKAGKQLLILLDEILKGTNSTDKQAGSIALVRQLLTYPALVAVATHDLVLGNMENEYPEKIRNFSFEASIAGDQLLFDYKLKRGVASKMNATFLMEKMGIIPRK
ncbi:MAG TPA: hypothetical protein VEB86_18435 [Chryseosolibacter sp.]|nr:hypothetical protein [Chryseosolibacter sp.]